MEVEHEVYREEKKGSLSEGRSSSPRTTADKREKARGRRTEMESRRKSKAKREEEREREQ